jgi:hypothetical protein
VTACGASLIPGQTTHTDGDVGEHSQAATAQAMSFDDFFSPYQAAEETNEYDQRFLLFDEITKQPLVSRIFSRRYDC